MRRGELQVVKDSRSVSGYRSCPRTLRKLLGRLVCLTQSADSPRKVGTLPASMRRRDDRMGSVPMIKIIHLLAQRASSVGLVADEPELCVARDHLEHALYVLERTLQATDHHGLENARPDASNEPYYLA